MKGEESNNCMKQTVRIFSFKTREERKERLKIEKRLED